MWTDKTTLETRRLRGDQIEVFGNIDSNLFYEIKES